MSSSHFPKGSFGSITSTDKVITYFVTQERCGNLNILLGKFIQYSIHLTDGEGIIILANHRVCWVDEKSKVLYQS